MTFTAEQRCPFGSRHNTMWLSAPPVNSSVVSLGHWAQHSALLLPCALARTAVVCGIKGAEDDAVVAEDVLERTTADGGGGGGEVVVVAVEGVVEAAPAPPPAPPDLAL